MVKIVRMECEKDTDYLVSMIAHTIVKSMIQKSLIEKIKNLYTRTNDKAMINDKIANCLKFSHYLVHYLKLMLTWK